MKKVILFILALILLRSTVLAHPGATDANGGHHVSDTGEYHFHHGYPAHQHISGQCPYDFDDQTGKSSGTSNNDSSNLSSGATDSHPVSKKPWYDTPIVAILILLVVGASVAAISTGFTHLRKRIYTKRQAYLESLRRQAQFESERMEYAELYEGRSPADFVDIPPLYEIGPDNLPREKGATIGWGDAFTVYTSYRGQCYHRTRYCCSAMKPVHVLDSRQLYGLRPCSKCRPDISQDFPWYREYQRISKIKEEYGIE